MQENNTNPPRPDDKLPFLVKLVGENPYITDILGYEDGRDLRLEPTSIKWVRVDVNNPAALAALGLVNKERFDAVVKKLKLCVAGHRHARERLKTARNQTQGAIERLNALNDVFSENQKNYEKAKQLEAANAELREKVREAREIIEMFHTAADQSQELAADKAADIFLKKATI